MTKKLTTEEFKKNLVTPIPGRNWISRERKVIKIDFLKFFFTNLLPFMRISAAFRGQERHYSQQLIEGIEVKKSFWQCIFTILMQKIA